MGSGPSRRDSPRSSGMPPAIPHCSLKSSGSPRSSGSPPTSEGGEIWGAFTIGDGIHQPSAIPFQLAPRLYVLSGVTSADTKGTTSAFLRRLFHELPCHLIFRELSPTDERTRQIWISEQSDEWNWELILVRQDREVEAVLTAIPRAASSEVNRLIWQKSGGWEPFGSNILGPHPHQSDIAPLIVTAP